MVQLYFHIGDHKTGSTSIQYALYHGLWECQGTELAYPRQIDDASLARSFYVRKRRKDREPLFQERAEWLNGLKADVAVISAEQFSKVRPQLLHQYIQRYMPQHAQTVRILAYLRPHAGSLLSHYTQRIKSGTGSETLDAYANMVMEGSMFDYVPRFLAWRHEFGDRLIVRPMIRTELLDGDVVKDFFGQVLAGAAFRLKDIPQTNESPEVNELALLGYIQRFLQRRELPPKMKVGLGAALASSLASSREGRSIGARPQIHRELAQRLLVRYINDARQMDKMFFGGRELMADSLTAAAKDSPIELRICDLRRRFDDRHRADLDRAIAEFVRSVREYGPMWQSVYRDGRGNARRSDGRHPDPRDQNVRRQAREVDAAMAAVVAAGVGLFHP